MEIIPFPMLTDNYGWLLVDTTQRRCSVVDPSESESVLRYLQEHQLKLESILLTHHHGDHTAGVSDLVANNKNVSVMCSQFDQSQIKYGNVFLKDGEITSLLDEKMTTLSVPGHTIGSVAYYFEELGAVFTGDTLFTAGCGRLLGGTAQNLFDSLQRLKKLPISTRIYCGHEYTEKNLRFAEKLEPDNIQIKQRLVEVRQFRARSQPTVPATLSQELVTNPFFRTDQPALQKYTQGQSESGVFLRLREERNLF